MSNYSADTINQFEHVPQLQMLVRALKYCEAEGSKALSMICLGHSTCMHVSQVEDAGERVERSLSEAFKAVSEYSAEQDPPRSCPTLIFDPVNSAVWIKLVKGSKVCHVLRCHASYRVKPFCARTHSCMHLNFDPMVLHRTKSNHWSTWFMYMQHKQRHSNCLVA